MTDEMRHLKKAKKQIQLVAAVTHNEDLLHKLDVIISRIDMVLEAFEDEPSREQYINTLQEIIDEDIQEGLDSRADVLQQIMSNIDLGIWVPPGEVAQEKENG